MIMYAKSRLVQCTDSSEICNYTDYDFACCYMACFCVTDKKRFIERIKQMNIGIFDSGIGGVTLLHQAMVMMPHENFIFYADTAHVPYGTKTREQVISYADDAIHFLQSCGCKAVVIACNTATAAAAEQMRKNIRFRSSVLNQQ